MSARDVLVAYASQTGSTAGIAGVIVDELRRAGLPVESRRASEVSDLGPYGAVILGSGVFLARRGSDGGGFLARHAAALANRRVWLFAVGPIGRPHAADAGRDADGVMDVARSIGAEGAAAFGSLGPATGADPLDCLEPVDLGRVRAWARAIALDLVTPRPAAAPHRVTAPAC
jgi:menaquinone-dependent protoporphyrinogen oxidase